MDRYARRNQKKALIRVGRLLMLIGALGSVFWGARLVLVAIFFTPRAQAASQKTIEPISPPDARRFIFDRNFKEMAVSFSFYAVYAIPLQIVDPEQTSQKVAEILGEDKDTIKYLLNKKRNIAWLADNVDENKADRLRKLELPGIKFKRKAKRFYPHSEIAAHVIGFVKEDRGLAGIECYYDNLLRPEGLGELLLDPELLMGRQGEPGGHLVLTLELGMQRMVEEKLAALVAETSAKGGGAVVMSASTGEILAMASNPAFDPNLFWEYGVSERNNRVTDVCLPCSVVERLNAGSAQQVLNGDNSASGGEQSPWHWQMVDEGLYVSPELAALQAPFPIDVEHDAVLGYQAVGRNSEIDLPEMRGRQQYQHTSQLKGLQYENLVNPCRVSALEALAGFSRLATGSIGVHPHLLRSFWDDTQGSKADKPRIKGFNKEKFLVVESLMSVPAVNVESGRSEQSPAVLPFQQPDTTGRYHTLLLARAALGNDEIAMAVVLENARIQLEKPSPARVMSQKLAGRLKQWKIANGSAPRPEKIKAEVAKLYRDWHGEFEMPGSQNVKIAQRRKVTALTPGARMPDLKGYSVRRALQELQQLGVVAKINGSGWVNRQFPPPGSLVNGKKCSLELTMARTEIIRTISATQ